jgi:Cu(I)/Ag(I) efflux system membrane fusion protein
VDAPAPTPVSQPPGGKGSTAAGKFWTFLRILNVRLRFIFLMVLIGLVVGNWESIMNHIDRWRRPAHAADLVAAQEVEYYCGMHPWIVQEQPGNCPICGMPLTKRAKSARAALPEGVLAQVQLTPLKMNMGRIGTSPIEYRLLARETRAVGFIDYDETRRATIAARFKGRLDELMVNFVGQRVKQGDPVASIYSPDLLVAQEELLTAVKAQGQQDSASPAARQMRQMLVDTARNKLQLWGLSPGQVDEIIRGGKAEPHITIASPISGIVTEKKALQGKYVSEGDELFTVADLSTVWLNVKVFESDVAGIIPGAAVEVANTAYPDSVFAGRITFVAYAVDPATRTLTARVEVANPDLRLKPGMFATATIRTPVGKVMETGADQGNTPASAQAEHQASTDALAKAYLALTARFAQGEIDAAGAAALAHEAEALAANLPQAAGLAQKVHQLEGKDLEAQREILKGISQETIKLFGQAPPGMELYIVHCPMVNADWLSAVAEVHNPYSSEMPTCGSITGSLKPASAKENPRFAEGYYCPLYPDHVTQTPGPCPLDNQPLKRVRLEKVLTVPESAVIDTGTRKIAYRQSAPGTFDMVEVKLGPRAGEYYPVLAGLAEGDQVATAGAFLVDAENRLNPSAAAQYFGATGGPQEQAAPMSGHTH